MRDQIFVRRPFHAGITPSGVDLHRIGKSVPQHAANPFAGRVVIEEQEQLVVLDFFAQAFQLVIVQRAKRAINADLFVQQAAKLAAIVFAFHDNTDVQSEITSGTRMGSVIYVSSLSLGAGVMQSGWLPIQG
ncbi:hypothetical protein D3C76_1331400 [compost metagenome]